MKRFNIYLLAIAALLTFSCSAQKEEKTFTSAQIKTLANIVGRYSLTDMVFDKEVCIAETGTPGTDLLYQLKHYGFQGVVSVWFDEDPTGYSSLDSSEVLVQDDPDWRGQVNLYVPFFYDHTLDKEYWSIWIDLYQFHYHVNRKGGIEIFAMDYWQVIGNTFPYSNVSVEFRDGRILFGADTSLYDFNRGEFVEGRLSATYIRP